MKTKILLLILFLMATQVADAQIMFEKTYGGSNTDGGSCVIQTDDDGYMVVGHTESFGEGGRDIYLIKTNEYGDLIWDRTYGGQANDQAGRILKYNDSSFIIIGSSSSYGAGNSDIYVVRVDNIGDTVWTKTYGGYADDDGFGGTLTNDSCFVIAGASMSNSPVFNSVIAIKINNYGDTIWNKMYNKQYANYGFDVINTHLGDYLIAGSTQLSSNSATRNIYVIKLESNGDTIWTKTYGGSDDDQAFSACMTNDNCYIISGSTKSFGQGGFDIFLMKLDTAGNELWFKTYGGIADDWGGMVEPTNDHGYIITGYTESYGAGGWDVYLIKTDEYGDTLWTKTFGGAGDEHGSCVKQTSDNGYIISSYSNSYSGNYDVLLIKTNTQGIMGFQKIFSNPDYIKIYPNPNNGIFNVVLCKDQHDKLTLSVFDINGRLCYKQNGLFAQTTIERIELTNLPVGFYIVNIQGTNLSVNKKIIINH